jgi:hypothetical protein
MAEQRVGLDLAAPKTGTTLAKLLALEEKGIEC